MQIYELVMITVIIEILEVFLQYKTTLKLSLFKIYNYYQKSPFLFFITNVGYIWLLFISIVYSKLNFALILGIILKSLDIFTKLTLIQKIFLKPDNLYISEISPILDSKLPFWVYLIGVLTYPYIVYFAFI